MKHTPGPWFSTPYWPSIEARKRLSPDHYRITTGSGSGYGQSFASVDSEANARLIAAAPEMLEALTALVNDPVIYGMHARIRCSSEHRKTANPLELAQAAIAKARGEK